MCSIGRGRRRLYRRVLRLECLFSSSWSSMSTSGFRAARATRRGPPNGYGMEYNPTLDVFVQHDFQSYDLATWGSVPTHVGCGR